MDRPTLLALLRADIAHTALLLDQRCLARAAATADSADAWADVAHDFDHAPVPDGSRHDARAYRDAARLLEQNRPDAALAVLATNDGIEVDRWIELTREGIALRARRAA